MEVFPLPFFVSKSGLEPTGDCDSCSGGDRGPRTARPNQDSSRQAIVTNSMRVSMLGVADRPNQDSSRQAIVTVFNG